MGIVIRLLLLILIPFHLHADAKTLAPGQQVPDFSLPAANGWGQRLAEVRGQAVMLIWLDGCDRCEERLAQYQLMAEGLQTDGLVTWFIWSPDDDDQPPTMRLPVLIADDYWRTGWKFNTLPAVMLINADGILDHLILGNLDETLDKTEPVLLRWLDQQQRLNLQAPKR